MNSLLFLQSIRNDILTYFFLPAALPLEELAVPLIAWFVWVGNRKFGWRSMLTISSGMLLATGFKNLFRLPRPWLVIEGLEPLHIESATGYSFPSGHSSFAVLFCFGFLYPLISVKFKKKWVPFVLCLLPTLYLMVSRLYYNVHTVNDVIAGALLGTSWLMICNLLFKITDKHNSRLPLLVMALPTLFALILILFPTLNQMPPYIDDTIKMVGMSIILTPFAIFESIKSPAQESIKPFAKWAYFLAGIAGVLLIKNSTGLLFKTDTFADIFSVLLEIVRYSLIGLFVLYIYPSILKLFKEKIKQ